MNFLDIVIILMVALSTIGGFTSGFSRLIVGLASSIAGIFLGFWFYGVVAGPLLPYVSRPEIANAIGFLVILGLCMAAGGIAGRVMARLFKWVGLSWFDRMLGGLAGFLRGVLVAIAVMTVVLAFAPSQPPSVIVESHYLPYLMRASSILADVTPKQMKDAFDDTESKVKEIWNTQKKKLPLAWSEGKG